jgi:hypothetical protein
MTRTKEAMATKMKDETSRRRPPPHLERFFHYKERKDVLSLFSYPGDDGVFDDERRHNWQRTTAVVKMVGVSKSK